MQAIAETIERNRNRLEYVRGRIFLAAGCLVLLTCTAQFLVDRLLPDTDGILGWALWFPAVVIGGTLLVFFGDSHRTITLADRSVINVWIYALGISGVSAVYAVTAGLPLAGFLTIGMSIAVAFTSELFRRSGPNKSNQSGSLVILNSAAGVGAWLAAQIFRAAHNGEQTGQFILTLAAVLILLVGTGLILCHKERHSRV